MRLHLIDLLWDKLINDARLNPTKSVKDILDDDDVIMYCWRIDPVDFCIAQKIIYDARQDLNFDYIKAVAESGLLYWPRSSPERAKRIFYGVLDGTIKHPDSYDRKKVML